MPAGDWQPSASREVLIERAHLFAQVRQFFAERGVLEIDTPVLSQGAASEPGLASFQLAQDPNRWLITSPEFAMKRALAAGSGPIYRLGPAFRAGEAGRWHNPEFCMLEWYRPGLDYHELMDEVAALLCAVATNAPENIPRYSIADVFSQAGLPDPHTASAEALRAAAEQRGWAPSKSPANDAPQARDFWLDLVLGVGISDWLADSGACFVTDYPASMAVLTQTRNGTPPLAERFELYWQGVELANGGNELLDPDLLQQRVAADIAIRVANGQQTQVGDARLIAAQRQGLPACAGVALGVDRLLALALGFVAIAPVLPFAWERA